MRLLKQSTAQTERIGPFLDKDDGVTEETGLSPVTELSKDGGAFATGPTGTHDAEGWYSIALTTTHTNTLGSLVVKAHDAATHLPVWEYFMVFPANVYDSLVAGSDTLDANVTEWLGTAAATPTVAGVPEVDVTHWLGTAAATPTVAGVPEVDMTHLGGVAQSATDLKDFADAGYDPGTNKVQGVVLVDTTTTNTDMLTAAAVNAEVDTALADIALDHLVSASVAGTDVADNSIVARLAAKAATADWDTFDQTTDSLEALRDRGDAAWTTGGGGSSPILLQNTTIATLASQTSFTLTAGSADDDAYNGATVVVTDSATSTQKAVGLVSDYTGSTKTVTLAEDPGIFVMAVGDTIDVVSAPKQLPDVQHDAAGGLPTGDANGRVDVGEWLGTAVATPTVGGVPEVDVTHMEGGTQTVTDLKDFADAGYDPGTNKVQGVVLVDTTTTNTDMVAAAPTAAANADAVWDEVLTTAAHNVVDSAGRRLRAATILSATVSDASPGATSFDTDLSETTNDFYNNQRIIFTNGSLAGQSRIVDDYDGTNKTITVSKAFTSSPANGDAFDLQSIHHELVSSRVDSILADTGDMQPKLGAPAADISADIAAVKAEADKIALADGGAGVAGSVIEEVQNRATPAQVNTECDTALSDIGLDHLLSAAVVGADVTDNSVIASMVSKSATADWDSYTNTTDALEAIRDKQTDIETDTQDIQTRLPAALVGGAMDSDVSNMQTGVVDADALATDAANEIAAAVGVQKNQAFSNLEFLMVDVTDGKTPETGLTVTGQRSLDGGAFGAVSGTIAEVGNGIYQFDALAADMNADVVTFRFSNAAALDTFITIKTTP